MTLISKEGDEDLNLIKVTDRYGGSMKVPRRLLMMSSVWRGALDIGSLPKSSDDSGRPDKKRKIDQEFQTDMSILAARTVFKLLDEQFIPQDYDGPSIRSSYFSPRDHYNDIVRAADQYDLPEILSRFNSMLWQLATYSKGAALVAFSVAAAQEDEALARFAIRHFQDLCHPIYLSQNTVCDIGSLSWRLLLRAVHGIEPGKIDWPTVARKMIFPKGWKQSNKAWDTLGLAIEIKEEPILSATSN